MKNTSLTQQPTEMGPGHIHTQNVSKFNKAEISLAILSVPNVIIFKIDTKQIYNRLKKCGNQTRI